MLRDITIAIDEDGEAEMLLTGDVLAKHIENTDPAGIARRELSTETAGKILDTVTDELADGSLKAEVAD